MSNDSRDLKVGQLIYHPEFGEGVIASLPACGLVSILFKNGGAKQVEVSAISSSLNLLDEMFLKGIKCPKCKGKMMLTEDLVDWD